MIATDTNDSSTRDLLDVIFAVLQRFSQDGEKEGNDIEIQKIKKSYISALYHNFSLNTKLWQSDSVKEDSEILDMLPGYLRRGLGADRDRRTAGTIVRVLDHSARLVRETGSPDASNEAPAYISMQPTSETSKSNLAQIFNTLDLIFDATLPEFNAARQGVMDRVELSRKRYSYSDFLGDNCEDLSNAVGNVLKCIQGDSFVGESDIHLEIVHGDLNPNNLLWSEAIQRFWLIDFEHVKLGYSGTDHLKLLFSSLVGISGRLFHTRGGDNDSIFLSDVVARNLYFTTMQLCNLGELFKTHPGSAVDVNRTTIQSWLVSKAGSTTEDAKDHFVTRILKVLVASHFGVPMHTDPFGTPDLSLNEMFSDYSAATSHNFRSFTVDEFRVKSTLFGQALPRFALREFCYQVNEVSQLRPSRVLDVTRNAGYDGSNVKSLQNFLQRLLKEHTSSDRVEKSSYKSAIQLAMSYFALKSVLVSQE